MGWLSRRDAHNMALIHVVLLYGLILFKLDDCLLFLLLRVLDPTADMSKGRIR